MAASRIADRSIDRTDSDGYTWFGGDHTSVNNFTLCDGSSRSVSKDVDLGVLECFVTRAGDDTAKVEDL